MTELEKSVADMIIEMLERRGYNALDSVLQTRQELEAHGKNIRQSQDYKLSSAELDVLVEALGDALWIRAAGADWDPAKREYFDPRLAGLNRLHEIRKERAKKK